jgi:hypothetical protein
MDDSFYRDIIGYAQAVANGFLSNIQELMFIAAVWFIYDLAQRIGVRLEDFEDINGFVAKMYETAGFIVLNKKPTEEEIKKLSERTDVLVNESLQSEMLKLHSRPWELEW